MRHGLRQLGLSSAFAGLALLSACAPAPTQVFQFQRALMHTQWDFSLVSYSHERAAKAVEAAAARIEDLDRKLAMWRPESELAKANLEAVNAPVTLSDDLAEVLSLAMKAHAVTGGAFDPTVGPLTQAWYDARMAKRLLTPTQLKELLPLVGAQQISFDPATRVLRLKPGMRLDLGGVAKGYAQDQVAAIFAAKGIKAFLMNAGGQVYVKGRKPGGERFVVGVLHPRKQGSLAGKLEIEDEVMATSGDYEQYSIIQGKRVHHLLDPRTGLPVQGMASATVLLPIKGGFPAAWTDCLAKAYVMGPVAGIALLEKEGALGCLFSESGGKLKAHLTQGAEKRLQLQLP